MARSGSVDPYTGWMDTSQRQLGATPIPGARQRRVAGHPHLIRRAAPFHAPIRAAHPVAFSRANTPDAAGARPLSYVAWRVATARSRQLQRLVEERERERDLALADAVELRLRYARLTARCYMLEAERRSGQATAAEGLAPAVPWYRRLWFTLIGKDARAVEWGAAPRLP
jgi:hypothetical protein